MLTRYIITCHCITHHLSLKIPQLSKVACLALISNFETQIILFFVGPTDWLGADFTSYFLFLFFSFNPQYPNSLNTVKKKKKEEEEEEEKNGETKPKPSIKKNKK